MEWISVSDQLPANGVLVIATNVNDNWIDFCVIDNNNWFTSTELHTFQATPINPSHWCRIPKVPSPHDLLPNWIFKVGYNHKGELNYEVNGAFMYLSEDEINKFRATISEAIYEAEKFYQDANPRRKF